MLPCAVCFERMWRYADKTHVSFVRARLETVDKVVNSL